MWNGNGCHLFHLIVGLARAAKAVEWLQDNLPDVSASSSRSFPGSAICFALLSFFIFCGFLVNGNKRHLSDLVLGVSEQLMKCNREMVKLKNFVIT